MIRVAIIGTENISAAHIQAYLAFPDWCRIVALCDIYPEKARARNEEYQLQADVYASYKDMLVRDDIDLVSICTPPFTHASIAIDLLNSGKHVVVEKPMAISLADCDAMMEAEQESGKMLAMIAQNRFFDPVMKLKKVLDTGLIGRVLHAQVDSYWWRGHCYYDLWWRGSWEKEGGGCTLNHAVHHIDMLGWMMGLPDKVTAVMSNVAHDNTEVEDISIAVLQYPKGSIAQITSSVIHHGEEQQIVFQGERARISVPWKTYASTSRANGFPLENTELEEELQRCYDSLPSLAHTGHEGEMDNILTAIETGTKPLVQSADGRRTIELVTAVYKAGSTGTTVELPLQKDDPYYTVQGMTKHAKHFYEKTGNVERFADNTITLGGNYEKR